MICDWESSQSNDRADPEVFATQNPDKPEVSLESFKAWIRGLQPPGGTVIGLKFGCHWRPGQCYSSAGWHGRKPVIFGWHGCTHPCSLAIFERGRSALAREHRAVLR